MRDRHINVSYEVVPLDGKFYGVVRNMDSQTVLAMSKPWPTQQAAIDCVKQKAKGAWRRRCKTWTRGSITQAVQRGNYWNISIGYP
jgi:hypothetical protein